MTAPGIRGVVGIDISKHRLAALTAIPGTQRRRGVTLADAKADIERRVVALSGQGQQVTIGVWATGIHHRARRVTVPAPGSSSSSCRRSASPAAPGASVWLSVQRPIIPAPITATSDQGWKRNGPDALTGRVRAAFSARQIAKLRRGGEIHSAPTASPEAVCCRPSPCTPASSVPPRHERPCT